jgi:hypothetical protein
MREPSVVTRTYTQHIQAPASAIFPLLCPVREAEWLDGWTYEMLHSRSGYAEEGCVFRTAPPGDPETIWMITRHDRDAGVVEFARVTASLVAPRATWSSPTASRPRARPAFVSWPSATPRRRSAGRWTGGSAR